MRAKASTGKKSTEGKLRYDYYRNTKNRIKEAFEKGFYLEVITLCESIICDRMEARIAYLSSEEDRKFRPIGDNCKKLGYTYSDENDKIFEHSGKELETNTEARNLYGEIYKWRNLRNNALHEMAKFKEGDLDDWETKYMKTEIIAQKGKILATKVGEQVKKLNIHPKK